MFLLLTRGHWSSPNNHGPDLEDSLSCLTWNPDKKLSKLSVELDGTDAAKSANDAAIFIKVGNFRFEKITFGARQDISDDNATVVYAYPTKCQVLFIHEHESQDVAFDMAWSTFAFLSGYAEAVTDIIGQEAHIKPEVIGSPNLAEQGPDDRYRVDFGMELEVSICVSTTVESHRLKMAFDKYSPKLPDS